MKKTVLRTLSLVFALVLVLGVLASCNIGGTRGRMLGKKSPDFNDVYLTTPKLSSASGITACTTVSALNGATDVTGSGDLVRYRDASGAVCVYNTKLGRVVLELSKAAVSTTSSVAIQGDLIRVYSTASGEKQTTVYSETGTALVTVDGERDIDTMTGGFLLDDKLYRVKDGALCKTYTIPPFVDLGEYYYGHWSFAGDYLVYNAATSVVYYDESFEAVAHYRVPGTAIYGYFTDLLENGKLFVCYDQYCDIVSKDYDYLASEGKAKIRVSAELFDPATGKTKKLDLDGVRAADFWTAEELRDMGYSCFTDKVQNILSYRTIEDGLVNSDRLHYVAIDNDGRLGVSLDGFIEGQRGLIQPLNSAYYYTSTETGYVILDTTGEVVKNTPAIGTAKEYGYLHNNMIYDEDFNLVVNLDGENTVALSTANSAIAVYYRTVGAQERYYVYTKNGEREILPPDGYEFYEYAYQPVSVVNGCIRAEYKTVSGYSYLYEYFTFDGTLLFRARSSAEFLADNLIRYTDESGDTVYARLS